MQLKQCIEMLQHKKNLDESSCKLIFESVFDPATNRLQIAALLVLLRSKPETAEELYQFVKILQGKMIPVYTKHKVFDFVGTGGDGANTINISTASAILAASCGIKVAKHGSRSASSLTGSADVLEALGVNINANAKQVSACIDEVGIGFCFAPNFHPMLREIKLLREELNVPTSFNLIGPLLNPAKPQHTILGTFQESLLPTIAKTLQQIGSGKSLVVHGCGLDELSCLGPVNAIEVTPTELKNIVINPTELGLKLSDLNALKGGDKDFNAAKLVSVLAGGIKNQEPGLADTLILNTGIALYLYGLQNNVHDGVNQAREYLQQGSALRLLQQWIEFTHD